MRKKVLSALLALTMCATLLVGCSGGSKETTPPATTPSTQGAPDNTAPAAPDYSGVELCVCTWGGTTGDATKKLAEDFEKQYGCTIVIDGINANSDRLAKLQSQIQSGVVEDDVVYFSALMPNRRKSSACLKKLIRPSLRTSASCMTLP
jgi:ABC-type glycerol-3-phosphate transport system substrate-binding protein